MKQLIEIRCPFTRKSKVDNNNYLCNRICVKVTAGSSGEAKCRSCHMAFDFSADAQAKPATGVRIKKQGIEVK